MNKQTKTQKRQKNIKNKQTNRQKHEKGKKR